MINKDVAAKWVAALRSGEYRQGVRTMKSEGGAMCCLGVLSDLYAKENPTAGFRDDKVNHKGLIPFYDNMDDVITSFSQVGVAMPTQTVESWIGASYADGSMNFFQNLAIMNDSGSSFAVIADSIEQHVNEQDAPGVE